MGFEEGTPELKGKAKALKQRYEKAFLQFHVTAHPRHWSGKRGIPGKCSNSNYCMRSIISHLEAHNLLDFDCMTMTSVDTDTIFPNRYFEKLAFDFLKRKDAKRVVWQAPLLYNFELG